MHTKAHSSFVVPGRRHGWDFQASESKRKLFEPRYPLQDPVAQTCGLTGLADRGTRPGVVLRIFSIQMRCCLFSVENGASTVRNRLFAGRMNVFNGKITRTLCAHNGAAGSRRIDVLIHTIQRKSDPVIGHATATTDVVDRITRTLRKRLPVRA